MPDPTTAQQLIVESKSSVPLGEVVDWAGDSVVVGGLGLSASASLASRRLSGRDKRCHRLCGADQPHDEFVVADVG